MKGLKMLLALLPLLFTSRGGHSTLLVPLTSIHTYVDAGHRKRKIHPKKFRITLRSKVQIW